MSSGAVEDMSAQLLAACNVMMAEARAARYYFGLSLGQATDYSALAVLEEQQRARNTEAKTFHCRHLHRWPLRTPYEQIVADVGRMLAAEGLHVNKGTPVLSIDATGTGAPVVALFERAKLRAQIKPCLLTGGDEVSDEGKFTRIPKRDLVSAAQVAFQSGRLKIAAGLEHTPRLVRELESFQVKIVLSSGDVETPWREGAHDDLVLAVMVALWRGQYGPGPAVSFSW
jgi:hypothetical protein